MVLRRLVSMTAEHPLGLIQITVDAPFLGLFTKAKRLDELKIFTPQ